MTDASEKPDGSRTLVPGPRYEVPVITAALSRRELRQREDITSVVAVETRRQRRERELADALGRSAVESEMTSTGVVTVVPHAASGVRATEAVASAAGVPAGSVPAAGVPAAADVSPATAASVASPVPASSPKFRRRSESHAAAVAVAAERAADQPAVVQPAALQPSTAQPAALQPSAALQASAAVQPSAAQPAAVSATAVPATAPFAPTAVSHASSVSSMVFDRASGAAEPRRASASVSNDPSKRGVPSSRHRTSPARRVDTHARPTHKRTIVNSAVMIATAGLVATLALPAYAYSDSNGLSTSATAASSELGIQSLAVGDRNGQESLRDGYTTTGNIAAMDSTEGTTVSPTVQALAAELVADVASGKLVGSVPDHIAEIRNLANGQAVVGCGVDYRVLQTIKVAVDNFDKVGVSDINRHCTNQIEGAGTASSHYKDGGGHAVDFYILNGHGLTGADADSLKLIKLLDPLVPAGSGLGQAECGRSISLSNFAPFDDTCTHLHIDFGNAKGVSLAE